jgi:hypothetical protein
MKTYIVRTTYVDEKLKRQRTNKIYRKATPEETKAAQEDGRHVTFICTCGHGTWSAKGLALNSKGQYTGARNLFYDEWPTPECKCPTEHLFHAVEVTK